MGEKKYSALLSELIEISKTIGCMGNTSFTAERFLIAVMEIDKSDDDGFNAELLSVRESLGKFVADFEKAKEALMKYICRENALLYIDDFYMRKKIMEAQSVVEAENKAEVDAVLLLNCILVEPSEPIKNIISEIKQDVSQKTEKVYTDLDAYLNMLTEFQEDSKQEPPEEEKKSTKSKLGELVADVKRIRGELQKSVYGQDNAISVFTNGFFQAGFMSMTDKTRKRPKATFLFAGPPGVGKTFLAEKAAQALALPFMRFDMSEYSDKEANIEFCGSDKVYKNSKPGNVTSFVSENPQCVLLFDEIEKANISVIHLFLQLLDAGRLRDNHTDEEVSFSDTIIIFTTNAGRQLYEDNESGDLSSISRKVIVKALQKDINPTTGLPFFPGAICSRFASGNVVMFNHIGAHNLRSIAKKEIERHVENLKKETELNIQVDERVYTALLFSEGSAADARTIRGRAETFLNEELYELLRLIDSGKVKTKVDDIEKIRVSVDLSGAGRTISEFFEASNKAKLMIFADVETVELCKKKISDLIVIGVQDVENAVDSLKTQDIGYALLDLNYAVPEEDIDNLNLEDVDSPARNFMKFLRDNKKDLPVYLLETNGKTLSEEEKISFMRQGVRGVISLAVNKDSFNSTLKEIASNLHQQASMIKLARENKIISFETAQTISKNGKNAEIKLFDFEMTVAVESEDTKDVLSAVSRPDVHFKDIIGAGEAKKELTYFVEYLKNPKKYLGTGVKTPKGILLYGPPGTGKTMLAKAMSCEADVTFIVAEGNQFLKKYVGEGSDKVHELFKTARKYAPSILFIDEIDAIAKERRGGISAAATGEETLTAFLTEMDGFVSDPSKPVFVLAATNFDIEPGGDKSLDPALMRRFDRRVYVELPNKDERALFLKMKCTKNSALEITEKQIDNISMRSTGMSLAELDSVVELALRSAIRAGSTVVTDSIFEDAFELFNNGETKKWDISQLERVARHEAGHALLSYLSGEKSSYLTIVARGNHGGYMQRMEQEGKVIYTRDELLARIRTSLGGRAAEIVYYGKDGGISTGASGDLMSATNIAQQIICTYGMDEEFGLAVIKGDFISNGMISVEVKSSINRILKEQMEASIRLISENKSKIDSLVKALMTKNHLNAFEIEQAINSGI